MTDPPVGVLVRDAVADLGPRVGDVFVAPIVAIHRRPLAPGEKEGHIREPQESEVVAVPELGPARRPEGPQVRPDVIGPRVHPRQHPVPGDHDHLVLLGIERHRGRFMIPRNRARRRGLDPCAGRRVEQPRLRGPRSSRVSSEEDDDFVDRIVRATRVCAARWMRRKGELRPLVGAVMVLPCIPELAPRAVTAEHEE